MDELTQLAELLKKKNAIDSLISAQLGRAAEKGHVGEFIASQVFDIQLHPSASFKASDGCFRSGPRAGRTVNIKWYAKQDYLLDLPINGAADGLPDYYLVLAGPQTKAKITHRPWVITAVYLFNAQQLVAQLQEQGKRIGIATGVNKFLWEAAEIYPDQKVELLTLSQDQQAQLRLFAPS